MGQVYRACDRSSGQIVAVKLLLGSHDTDRARFEREVQLLSELQHPGIVRYVEHGATPEGRPYLAMEWLEGENLQSRLARGRLSIAESLQVAMHAAEALAPAHARGVVHRDLKPSNLFLVHADATRIKVLDFGIARLGNVSRMTRTGLLVGTPAYMAPEQARGIDVLDPRADVFSLGCVLFECLTGSRAFAGDHLMAILAKILFADVPRVSDLRPDVPSGLDALVGSMLAKEPAMRPADGAAVAKMLGRFDASLEELPSPSQWPLSEGARSSDRGRSLTRSERRVLSVVLLGRDRPLGFDTTQTIVTAAGELRAVAETGGGRFELLADGSAVITIATLGNAADQAVHAARCALSLQALAPGRPIALATGRGEMMGKPSVGDLIDQAVRLLDQRASSEFEGKGMWPVALDDVTAGLLDGRFEVVRRPGGFELRGEHSPAAGARTLLGKPTPCVGRERELLMLAKLFDECVEDSTARAVVVTAPAGFGKSRLVQEFLRDVRQRCGAVEIWVGRGDMLRANAAFGTLGHALRAACGIRDGEPLAVRREKLRGRIARQVAAADRRRVADFLGELASVPMPDEDSAELRAARQDAGLMGVQMRSAWEDFLRAECAAQPVLLVLEDMHWGDQPTVRFVDAALRSHRSQPWMVVALGRPEVHGLFPRLWADRHMQQLRLQRLTARASLRLVRQVLGDTVDPAHMDRLVTQADGHAFYLEELIRAVAEGRGAALPEVVVAMVQARLDTLEADARRVLRAASVFGEVFWQGAVEALLGGGPEETQVGDWLASLTERELVVRHPESRFGEEPEFSFWHALLREGAYAMLTEQDRILGHCLAAEWLEQRVWQRDSAPGPGPQPDRSLPRDDAGAFLGRSSATGAARLAEHFEIGREPRRAAAWYTRAAEQALWAADSNEAIACAERGLALLEMLPESDTRLRQELDLKLYLATGLTAIKGYAAPEVEHAFSRAWQLCQAWEDEEWEDASQRFPSLFGLWRVHLVRGRHRTACKLGEDLLALASRSADAGAVIAAHHALGISCFFLGELAPARAHLERVIALYDRDRHRHLTFLYGVAFEVECLAYLSAVSWFSGFSDHALATIHSACALAETLSHPFTLTVVLSVANNLYQAQHHTEAVRAYSERVLALAAEHGFSHYALQAAIIRGWALSRSRDREDAVAQMHHALSVRRGTGAEMGLTYFLSLQAEVYATTGRTGEALAVLDEIMDMVDRNGERFWAPEVYRMKGEILRSPSGEATIGGSHSSAEHYLLQARDMACQQGALILELRAVTSLSRLWEGEDKREAVRQMLSEVLSRFTEGFDSVDVRDARALLSGLT